MFMRRRAFFLAPLMFIVLVLGLGSLMGRSRTNDAYQAGFAAGQAAVVTEEGGAETGAAAASAPEYAPYGYRHYHGIGFFGGFFKVLFFFFLFGWLFKMFGFWRWRRWHKRHGGPWHRGHGPAGHDDTPNEKGPEDLHYV